MTDPDHISYAKDDAEMHDRVAEADQVRAAGDGHGRQVDKLEGKAAQEKLATPLPSTSRADAADRQRRAAGDVPDGVDHLATIRTPATCRPIRSNDFEIQMRLNLEGIGAALEAPDGDTVVKKIIPGRSGREGRTAEARRSNRWRRAGDRRRPIVDVVDMKLSDVVKLIRGEQGTIVRLKCVPKGETEPKIYNIVREQIELTDSEARSDDHRSRPASPTARPTRWASSICPASTWT